MEWPLYYVIFSSGILNRTSSHICGRWYLPTFLLRDGSLALMYITSFMALLRFLSSFPTILKFSNLMLWPVVHQQPSLMVPYYQGLSESVKRTCNKYGVQVYFKGGVTIKSLLMAPKDQDPMLKRSGVIYKYSCDRVDCDEEYIGESSRNFGERLKEHQKAPSPIFDHYTTTGHNIKLENFSIVGKEDKNLKRAIKEDMYIRANDPSLNRNVGKYHLPHIWDEVLFNIPELKIT